MQVVSIERGSTKGSSNETTTTLSGSLSSVTSVQTASPANVVGRSCRWPRSLTPGARFSRMSGPSLRFAPNDSGFCARRAFSPSPSSSSPTALSASRSPRRLPTLEVDGTSLWRVPGEMVSDLALGQLLIADGHHRYESTLDFGDELGTEARIMALVVETTDPGLDIFPTHRVFAGRPDLASLQEGESYDDLDSASTALESEPTDRAAAVAYRPGGVELVRGVAGQLDAELVDSHGLEGIRYTPRADEAVRAVERGEADVAYLMRRPRVDDVFALARRGERMPPKSTYFFPKPLSGLVFHPLAA